MSRVRQGLLPFFLVIIWALVPALAAEPVFIPNYWDSKRRFEKPDLGPLRQIRFATESDFPPFHFVNAEGVLTGFDVDLARAICLKLKVSCSIQPRRWDTLTTSIEQQTADALIAAYKITAEAREKLDFSAPYHRSPARFVAKTSKGNFVLRTTDLKGLGIAAAENSAHAAYLRTAFGLTDVKLYKNATEALESLQRGDADLAFVDGVVAAFWLNGQSSDRCCQFIGGPYTESRFFGEGIGIAVKKGNTPLRQAFDWAMQQLGEDGTYAELYLKYFPVSPY